MEVSGELSAVLGCRAYLHPAQRRPEASKRLSRAAFNSVAGQVSELLYPECITLPKIKVGHVAAVIRAL